MARPRIPMRQRLLNHFSQEGNGCWEWNGSRCHYGYGSVGIWDGVKVLNAKAHRLVYQEFVAPIPNGLLVLHKCDNRGCVNPDHLYLGTQADNMNDVKCRKRGKGIKNRRHGERSHLSVLKDDQVRLLRNLVASGVSVAQARRDLSLPISYDGVKRIIDGKCWRHVK